MTAQIAKPGQKRLDSCVLALPKWAKIREKPREHAAEPSKPVILQPTPPSELKTPAKLRKLDATQSYLGNFG